MNNKKSTVHIVMGTTGEYSDRSEWPVCGYADKALADKHADEAKLWDHKNGRAWDAAPYGNKPESPWDLDYHRDYTGTDYYVIGVDIRDALPEVKP